MARLNDVAAYIIAARGPMPSMKLQKLAYYALAWSLVWDERPLFDNKVQAWANGPVIPDLYQAHRGQYLITHWPDGDGARLTDDERDTVDAVLRFYGDKSAQVLSDLTHREDPWRDARQGLPPGERGNSEITLAAMAEYYGGL